MGRTDYALWTAVGLCLVDWAMTVPHWSLEGNPVVLALGPWGTLAVKLGAVCGLLWAWYRIDGVRHTTTATVCVWALSALYAVVVVTNGIVLLH